MDPRTPNAKSDVEMAPKPPVGQMTRFGSTLDRLDEAKEQELDKIGNASRDDDSVLDKIGKYRVMLKKFKETSTWGQTYDFILLGLSLFSPLQYIYGTYINASTSSGAEITTVFSLIELIIAAIFTWDWILCLFLADNTILFVTNFFSMVDLMTVVPIWVLYGHKDECMYYSQVKTFRDVLIYIVCGMSTTRVLRALRIRRRLILIEDEVQRCMSEIGLKIICMILFDAALQQYLESEIQQYMFHTWMYQIWITVATVGYGDIAPKTDLGRYWDICLIAFSLFSMSTWTNELVDKMALMSVYARASYTPKSKAATHVIICGELASVSLRAFFEELFHEDHDAEHLYAVILQPDSPPFEILMLLKDPKYALQVTYLEGSVLIEKDLVRCKAEDAAGFFIMTNKFSSKPDEEDAKTILQQFSIKRYMVQNDPSLQPLFCMQLIRPENRRHLVGGGAKKGDVSSTDLVICLNEIKMGVIAKAVMFPGINTLIMNLLTSFADDDEDAEDNDDPEVENLNEDDTNNWLGEYQKGCGWEIYTTELADMFEGLQFAQLSESLYQRLGVVLFGLQIEDLKKDKSHIKMLLNPADFVIPSKEDFKIDAFVIATDKAHSDLSFDANSETNSSNLAHVNQIVMMAGVTKAMGAGLLTTSVTNARSKQAEAKEDVDQLKKQVKMQSDRDKKKSGAAGSSGFKRQAWQELLHRHDSEKKKNADETYQEEMHKIEEASMMRNYYMRSKQASIEESIVSTSLQDELPGVSNHIIIIGKELSSLYDLVLPLRSKVSGALKYIVVLYPHDFPHAVWQRISIFEGIFIVRGSALEEADLRRAGVFRAKQVVVLGDVKRDSSAMGKGGKTAGSEALVDADSIFCYQCVKRMNENSNIVIEIVRHANVSYLDPESGLTSGDVDYKFTPQFASGSLFISSLLDTMVCQAFYNPHIISVLNKLVGGEVMDDMSTGGSSSNHQSISVSAAAPSTSMTTKAGDKKKQRGSSLYQIQIPEGLESRTYGSLFKFLAARKIIPLGLYRGVFSHMKMGPKMNKESYVFANPPKDTELFSCDSVYVLSQLPLAGRLNVDSNSKKSVDTDIIDKEILYLKELRNQRNLVESTADTVLQIRSDVTYLEDVHHDMQDQLDDLAARFDDRVNLMLSALKEINGGKEFRCVKEAPPLAPLTRWEDRMRKDDEEDEPEGVLNLAEWEKRILLGSSDTKKK